MLIPFGMVLAFFIFIAVYSDFALADIHNERKKSSKKPRTKTKKYKT